MTTKITSLELSSISDQASPVIGIHPLIYKPEASEGGSSNVSGVAEVEEAAIERLNNILTGVLLN